MSPKDADSAPPPTHNSALIWSFVDAALLILVLAVSSDMLVQLGKIQSLVWLLCYALALLRIGMLFKYFLPMIARDRLMLAYPLVCLASVLWSMSKSASLVSATQLTMTVLIAAYLGRRYSMTLIIRVVAIVISVAIVLSLLQWATHVFPWPVYTRAGGLAGIFSHKNMLGQRALFGLIAIKAIWLAPFDPAVRMLRLLRVPMMFAALLVIALSESMTSVLLVPVLLALMLILCLRRIPPVIAIPAITLSFLAAALGPLLLGVAGIDPVAAVLDSVGKSSTLTGRTDLWVVASEVSAEYPVLGVGYGAFWNAAAFANERLLTQEAGAVTSRSFHNFIYEIRVGTGLPGLLAMAGLLAATTRRLFMLYTRRASVPAAAGLVMLVAIFVTSLLGTTLFRGHDFAIILVVMFFVSSAEDLGQRARRPEGQIHLT